MGNNPVYNFSNMLHMYLFCAPIFSPIIINLKFMNQFNLKIHYSFRMQAIKELGLFLYRNYGAHFAMA